MREACPDTEVALLNDLTALEELIAEFGLHIQVFREQTRDTDIEFEEIVEFMTDTLYGPLRQISSSTDALYAKHRALIRSRLAKEFDDVGVMERRLMARMDSILSYASAQGELRMREFGVHNEVERVIGEIEDLISRRRAKVVVTGKAIVVADQLKIAQMLQNLISNAIKYTPIDRDVRVDVQIAENRVPVELKAHDAGFDTSQPFVYISVRDRGVGIREDELAEVFKLFRRGSKDAEHALEDEGTGIGLAIVDTVVNAHGGLAWINSVQGRGTRVSIVIPSKPKKRSAE